MANNTFTVSYRKFPHLLLVSLKNRTSAFFETTDDVAIFSANENRHTDFLCDLDDLADMEENTDKFTDAWALFMDIGCTGFNRKIRAI